MSLKQKIIEIIQDTYYPENVASTADLILDEIEKETAASGAVELREAFERWIKSYGFPIDRHLSIYKNTHTAMCWNAWQASRKSAALARPVAEEPAAPVEGEGRGRIAVAVQTMKTSKGADYYVSVACGDRSCTPHMFLDRYKAEYEVAHWQWIFGQRAEEPYILDYSEETYPNLYPKMEPSAAAPKANGVGTGGEDKERLDWLEQAALKSRTGISFDHIPSVEGEASGWRFMRRFFIGEARKSLRAAIDAARGEVEQMQRREAAPTPSQGNDEGVR